MNTFDLSLISDADLNREYWRRAHARGQAPAGRPKKLTPCPKCGEKFGVKELEKHTPKCEHLTRYFIDRPEATGAIIDKGETSALEYVTAEGIRLAWSGVMPLPNIGATIDITMNNIGLAHVKGYFMEGGWLGVMTKPINPPAWLRKKRDDDTPETPQWAKDGIGCEFGTEIAIVNTGRKK